MRKQIMVVANSDWLLYHFRLPLLKSLEREGLEILLVCPEGPYMDRLQAEGYRWLPWRMDRKSISPFKALIALGHLMWHYRRVKPAATHHITIQPIFYGSIAARFVDVPVVINNFTGLGFLFSNARMAFWLRKVTLPIMRWAMRRKGVYTVLLNDQDRQELIEREMISKEHSLIIPGDGVDLDRFHPPKDRGEGKDEIVVLMAARLLWDKGVAEFVQAARAVKGKVEGVQFLLAGETDPGNPTSIPASSIEGWREEGFVEFLGYVEEMAPILREADIAVLPSYHEGVPVFLLEAAASGLPIIATDLEGCRMIIEEGENGFLIPKGNVGALSNALYTLIKDPELREKMGRRCREIVEKDFNQKEIVTQFISLYRELGILRD